MENVTLVRNSFAGGNVYYTLVRENKHSVGWNPRVLSNVATFNSERDALSFAEAHDLFVTEWVNQEV